MASMFSLSSRLLTRCAPTFKTIRLISRTTPLRAMEEELRSMVKPTDFQKFVLVWTKVYKTKEVVPDRVSFLQMKRAMDMFRVRSTVVLVLLGLVGCYMSILSGRRLRDSGDSLSLRGTQQEIYWREKELARLANEAKQTEEKNQNNN